MDMFQAKQTLKKAEYLLKEIEEYTEKIAASKSKSRKLLYKTGLYIKAGNLKKIYKIT